MGKRPNFYKILGISRSATSDEIRHAYRAAVRQLHPDVNEKPGDTELFLHVQEAYEILANPQQRAAYDAQAIIASAAEPIQHELAYSAPALLRLDEPQLVYALLDLAAPADADSRPQPPLNISLVLDCSTSMQGDRLEMVKAAALELIHQLRPQDILSIVAFSDRAETLLRAEEKRNWNGVETQIRMLRTGGGTEIFQGLVAGYLEVRRNLSPRMINQVILLTDGHTYGDEDACLNVAGRAADDGIIITGLGVGSDWNDAFLDSLTTRTGGRSFFISRAADIKSIFREKLRGLGQVYAEQTTLDLKTGPGVELRYVYRLRPDAAPLPIQPPLRLGSVPKSGKLSLLLEFCAQHFPKEQERAVLAAGDIHLVIPSQPDPMTEMMLEMVLPLSDRTLSPEPPEVLVQAVSQVTLYRMQERARQEASAGEAEKASRILNDLATHLLAQSEPGLAQTVLMEAERIRRVQSFSQEGEKQIKYGTQALKRLFDYEEGKDDRLS